jgi:riboflavin synthase
MSQYARVNSVAMLKLLQASLATFSDAAAVALDEVGTDIQRALAWLGEDRKRYWTNQVRVCGERMVQAKLALKQKNILDRTLSGTTSSAIDERKALAIAERRLREAESKLARTRSWIMQIEKLQSDYRGGVQGLISAIDADIPNARARLDKMIDSLEAYVALAPPEVQVDLEERRLESVLRPEPEHPGTSDRTDLRQIARTLRERVPPAEVRRETIPVSEPPEWLSGISFPDAWGEDLPHGLAPDPGERVVVAGSEGDPEAVFFARMAGGEGDSGWFIGPGDKTESQGYVAVRVADLVQAQSRLQHILSLPTGCLIVIDCPKAIVSILDAEDNMLWQSPGNTSAPKQE